MNGRRGSLVALAVGAVLGVSGLAALPVAPASAAEQVRAAVPQLKWAPCGPAGFECATASVPTDHDRPAGARTTIALTRLPASDPAHRIGTLFTNPGGPGGSGVDFVQQAATIAYDPQVRARYDILGFDPRGVGASTPATCFRTAAQEQASPLLADPYPVTAAEERRFQREALEIAVRCQATSPGRFASASTANVARDLDLLRQAVGDEKLNYVGYSYGTYLGATYAKLFPGRVGRWILDGTVDPAAWSGTGSGDAAGSVPVGIRVRQGPGASEELTQFYERCEAAGPQRCLLAALGDPAKTVPALLDRLLTDPVDLPVGDGTTVTVTQQIAVASIFQAMYYPAQWSDLAAFLVALDAGDQAQAAAAVARTSTTVGARVRGDDYPSFGGALASLCVDARQSRRPLEYPRFADRADATAPYLGRYRSWIGLPCEYWALSDPDVYRGPWKQTTKAAVLVVGTRFDPATPFRQTAPYTALFPAGRQLTVEGYGHTTIPPNVSACAQAAETRYLTSGVLPAAGTVCAQDVDPFPAPATARAKATAGYLPPPPLL